MGSDAFRVLLVDDETGESFSKNPERIPDHVNRCNQGSYVWPLKKLAEEAMSGARVEAFVAKDGALREVWQVHPEVRSIASDLKSDAAALAWLERIDVVLLDLMGVQGPRQAWSPGETEVPDREDRDALSSSYGGAAFYLGLRSRMESFWSAVVIITAGDTGEPPWEPVLRHLYKYCADDHSNPWTVVYPKLPFGPARAAELLIGMYGAFSAGFWELRDQGQVEFAASHDMPVLIVGETGTGKEGVARRIFERWRIQKARDGTAMTEDRFQVLNCGGLLPDLARSELFGHVRGAYTGADDHEIGKILTACGVERIQSDPRLTSAARGNANDALRQLKDLTSALQVYSRANNAGQQDVAIQELQRNVVPQLTQILASQAPESVFAVLRMVTRAMEGALRGRDFAEDFRERLVGKNSSRMEVRSDGNVGFRDARPHGMLFLDEFGDLPPDVQRMLLRFLESHETEPLGFPGRVIGARVRVVAATSDPRIAAFVGERLWGSWRTREEMERPLREDLLHRLKAQVIRVEAIDEDNAERFVNAAVAGNRQPRWKDEAVKRLIELVKGQLKAVREATEASERGEKVPRPPSFGHRRELHRVVALADALVEGAVARGMRNVPAEVSQEVVERIWKPSMVSLNVEPTIRMKDAAAEDVNSLIQKLDIKKPNNGSRPLEEVVVRKLAGQYGRRQSLSAEEVRAFHRLKAKFRATTDNHGKACWEFAGCRLYGGKGGYCLVAPAEWKAGDGSGMQDL